MQIRIQAVAAGIAERVTSRGENSRQSITIHETANVARGANAASHANLQSKGNSRSASWHLQVDDREAVRSFSNRTRCWHAGSPVGNRSSIGIEVCVNSDGNWRRAVENAAELTREIMRQEGIPLSRVRQHHSWTRKNCPTRLRGGIGGITWEQFLAMVAAGTPAPTPAPAPVPVTPVAANSAARRAYEPGQVRRIQEILYAAGYYTGARDDDYGPMTREAVRAYQAGQVYPRLVADGDWGTVTEAHCQWVVRLQAALNEWKSTSPKLRVDGDYRSVTVAAVAAWQRRNRSIYRRHGGQTIDGIAGPATCAGISIPAHP